MPPVRALSANANLGVWAPAPLCNGEKVRGWWGGGQTSHPRRPVHVVGDATTFLRFRSSEVVEAAIIWPADTTETRKELMITNAPSRLLMPGLAADLAAVSLVGATAEASGPSAQLPCSPSSSGAL